MSGTNQFSIGRDAQLTIMSATGPLTFNIITSFDSKPQYQKVASRGIDGVKRIRNLPDGHAGSFKIDRADSAAEDYFLAQEANFFAGLNPDAVTITQTISEGNGSVTQYQYTSVALELADAGSWAGLEKINQTINFEASRKIKAT